MPEPTAQQRVAATALDVSLAFSETPIAIAKLCEIVWDLRCKVDELEQQKTGSVGMVAETQIGERYIAASKVRAMVRSEIAKSTEAVERAIGEALGTVAREVEARLTAKIAALESAANVFKGVWAEGEYRRGSIVAIPAAGIYRALSDTQARPGSSGDWQLLVKAGRDGKDGAPGRDGRDFTPPEPRTVRTAR